MNDAIQVREAIESDLSVILGFQVAMAKETESLDLDQNTLARGIQSLLQDPAKGKYYVALLDSRVIGCLMITYEWSDWRNGLVLWIQSVYVDGSFRGQGVYKNLYEHIKSIAMADKEIKGIRLYVDTANGAAQEVYRRLGMNGDHYQVFEWMK
jgi:ribosomal protein S18 acetylase RimI-like enzyme